MGLNPTILRQVRAFAFLSALQPSPLPRRPYRASGLVVCRARAKGTAGASALVVGCGGVGSAIAASLAAAGVTRLGLFDAHSSSAASLGSRLTAHYPKLEVQTGVKDSSGYDIVVNATPIGMNDGDPLPMDVDRIAPSTFVGEVVMKQEMTPFLRAAQAKGCAIQIGVDMLFEQIPAYLEFFGFPDDDARRTARRGESQLLIKHQHCVSELLSRVQNGLLRADRIRRCSQNNGFDCRRTAAQARPAARFEQ